MQGRLSTLAAAFVIARRDFTAILFSRSFIFFLLGPLFPVLVGALAGGIGKEVQSETARPQLGVAMQAADAKAMLAARATLEPRVGAVLPEFVVVRELAPGEAFDARAALADKSANLAAVVSGTPASPELTGPPSRIKAWEGPVSLVAAQATGQGPQAYPEVGLTGTGASKADDRSNRVLTAQAGQMLLFLLTMLLAGMVLSNLVEEKGNKIIEVLAAAIPMDAVFLGKLFAMLAVSMVGIACWAGAGGLFHLFAGQALPSLTAPAVGWPLFFMLGIAYFAMAYLLIGSIFLAIGSMATTVREVQTLSMPATMLQLVTFFVASYAMARPGSAMELAACIIPFSSPFAMIARAAQDAALWPHAAALAWQAFSVFVLVRMGAALFRSRVMKSGPAGRAKPKRRLFARA
ncbi:MAG TPA: ABC transporter permease [Novosphingobium sp.]|nr:ABC transporter permease [Novosphingobium sp.]HMP56614.1 ABC transporter permease [Novosphingobium sp.]